jgi:hydrogenase expression/formation protein HypE
MDEKILLGHGSGGRMMRELIERFFVPAFADGNTGLGSEDSAVLDLEIRQGERLAVTTDSYVVSPVFFPGGNIGDLAVNGTVNDLAMAGAKPLYLTAGFIVEEGLPVSELAEIVGSMKEAAEAAGVIIVAGDTKVVDRGKADRIFINTSGVGVVPSGINISSKNLKPGDVIIISGSIGDHGMAVMSKREGLGFEADILSDSAPLNSLVADMLAVCPDIHAFRDPTRGGVTSTLIEFAEGSGVGIVVDEKTLPISDSVRGACEILGLDPLFVANEGKLIASVPAGKSEAVLEAMKKNRYGSGSVVIGKVVSDHPGRVLMKTLIGGTRIIDMLSGEQLPRIC